MTCPSLPASRLFLGLLMLALSPSAVLEAQNPGHARTGLLQQPNILLVVGDDMGVDMVSCYGEGAAPPCTPNIDALAARGLLFRNAWTNPQCSPTRAQLLTGRHGFRTGIGEPVRKNNLGLRLTEWTLPEMLGPYTSSATGKWHLAGWQQGKNHPRNSGFGYHAGSMGNLLDYFTWQKVINGSEFTSTTYATTDCADEAIAAALAMPEPWLLYAAFQAPHTPRHIPPKGLCACGGSGFCQSADGTSTRPELVKAMVESLDTEIGRLLQAIQGLLPNTLVVFMGDNGTGGPATEPPFDSTRAKGTLYEGGINVPLIIAGAGTVTGECAALVNSTDLFATCAELAGVPSLAEDSVSMVPYLQGTDRAQRRHVYAEFFSPNGQGPYTTHTRAVRNLRYKLIRSSASADEFYDLWIDPFEQVDLFPGLTPSSPLWVEYSSLVAELVRLGVG